MSVQPYTVKEQKQYLCNYGEHLPYCILTIDRESYICNVTINNSDEGQVPVNKLVYNLQVGRYCSIAEGLYVLIGRGKNYHNVTTSAARVFDCLHKGYNEHGEHGSVIIQNDVWIGTGVTIMGGVTVHNGAVIAANSHVVKDVPPYAIVGGNPAKVIGYRFEQNIIEKLQKIQWWYWDEKKIEENASYFDENVQRFCDLFYPKVQQDIENIKNKGNIDGKDRYLMLVDNDDNYSVLPDVIDEYLLNYSWNENKELVLLIINNTQYDENNVEQDLKIIQNKVQENKKIKCTVVVKEVSFEDVKEYMPTIKHLIINRRKETVQIMCWAKMFGDNIEIISGVDVPIFGGK